MNSSEQDPLDTLTLVEILFHVEQFCSRIETAVFDCAPCPSDDEEMRLKLSQCRGLIDQLQQAYEEDRLSLENAFTRGHFRMLIMALMWVAYRGRRVLNHRLFRMLIMIESGFTYLLISRPH